MKLFQQLLVAPAALGLLAPVAANAAELNINGVSEYTGASEQVTSVTQFSDVYPTDWAYQALSNLVERYGCVAGYPNGTFRGNRAMTRYEAAALLNACLDRITEVTDELKRLMKEFERELAILKGRVDGLEARVGELEATQFSTTTKLKGQTTFVIGAVNAGGDNGSKYTYDDEDTKTQRSNRGTVFSNKGTNGGASAYNRNFGATTFNYDQRLAFVTSYTGKDKLFARLRAGNFDGDYSAFKGKGVSLTGLDTAESTKDAVKLDRLYYKFPVGREFTVIVGAIARNTESLALWPSKYNKGGAKILDWTGLAGTSGVYNKETGPLIGAYWKQKVAKGDNAWSVSVNYVSDAGNGNNSNSASGGFMTSNSEAALTAQLGYAGSQWGAAFGYRYGQCGDNNQFRKGTSFASTSDFNQDCSIQRYNSKGEALNEGVAQRSGSTSNSYALNAYWQPEESGWVPTVSVGWGFNNVSSDYKKGGSSIDSQSWMVGLKWSDVFLKGNALGFAFGQPTFATAVKSCNKYNGVGYNNVVNGKKECSETSYDGNYAFELYYNFKVTDNISITPAVFYLSRPMGQNTQNLVENGTGYDGEFNIFGGLVQTTFKF